MKSKDTFPTRWCAVYTRKSTEEGLDQAFNSLHAQREACEAYIKSQAHEGWKLCKEHFDDGGFSGGTLERPALTRLLDAVRRGSVNVIVVYKIDRLTRSLADFARLVEVLDAHGASFVSVTQQFNTTSSMGRLTLNVLLSFAQFEREVTGERIRDKFAASKSKGMWMGGPPPIGYDIQNRNLVVNGKEADVVRGIFARYSELRSVTRLAVDLKDRGIKSKSWVSRKGVHHAGGVYSRGALYKLLRNPLYIGEVSHRGARYPGQHEGIVPRELWDEVNSQLDAAAPARSAASATANAYLLQGLLRDDEGHPMSPHHTKKSCGRQYRYYVSQAIIRKEKGHRGSVPRLPAQLIEDLIEQKLLSWFNDEAKDLWEVSNVSDRRDALRRWLRSVEVRLDEVVLTIDTDSYSRLVSSLKRSILDEAVRHGDFLQVRVPARFRRCGAIKDFFTPDGEQFAAAKPDPKLVKAVARAYRWRVWLESGEVTTMGQLAAKAGLSPRIVRSNLQLAFLAPDIVEAILEGRTRGNLSVSTLTSNCLALAWTDQRAQLL